MRSPFVGRGRLATCALRAGKMRSTPHTVLVAAGTAGIVAACYYALRRRQSAIPDFCGTARVETEPPPFARSSLSTRSIARQPARVDSSNDESTTVPPVNDLGPGPALKVCILTCAQVPGNALPAVSPEGAAIERLARGAAEWIKEASAERLQEKLAGHTRVHFAGHANAELGDRKTLAWIKRIEKEGRVEDRLELVDAVTLAAVMSHLELVVLNGCESSALGEALARKGVQHVICWDTVVADEPARLFAGACAPRSLSSLPTPSLSLLTSDASRYASQRASGTPFSGAVACTMPSRQAKIAS